jgi:hypothetical protein
MDRRDDQFENFLREFKPRRPRALPDAHASAPATLSTSTCRLAAAAVITAALGASLWFLSQNSAQDEAGVIAKNEVSAPVAPIAGQVLSAWTLTRLVLEDPTRLDAALASSRGSHLPRFDREGSILRVLAKE